MALNQAFTKIADRAAKWSGLPATFIGSCTIIGAWGLAGPLFRFSETWMLIVNTGTSVVTFLMVFLIQNKQIRHTHALQMKLDELIRSSEAKDDFVGIEHLSHVEAEEFRARVSNGTKKRRRRPIPANANPTRRLACRPCGY